eukprot:12294705-Prorocentrum_lima.AAC.1
MTSSLVGSEMCIRDRVRPAAWHARAYVDHDHTRAGARAETKSSACSSQCCLLYTSDAADDM